METQETHYDTFIIGYHRLGWKLCDALERQRGSFAIIDYNPEAVERATERGMAAFFGDATDIDFLESLPIAHARLFVLTFPEAEAQMACIKHIRKMNKRAIIIGTLGHKGQLPELYEAGADFVMLLHILGAHWISRLIAHKKLTRAAFTPLRAAQEEDLKLRHAHGRQQDE